MNEKDWLPGWLRKRLTERLTGFSGTMFCFWVWVLHFGFSNCFCYWIFLNIVYSVHSEDKRRNRNQPLVDYICNDNEFEVCASIMFMSYICVGCIIFPVDTLITVIKFHVINFVNKSCMMIDDRTGYSTYTFYTLCIWHILTTDRLNNYVLQCSIILWF